MKGIFITLWHILRMKFVDICLGSTVFKNGKQIGLVICYMICYNSNSFNALF